MISKVIGIAELQRKVKKVLDEVKRTKEPYLVISRNKPKAVLLDVQKFNFFQRQLMKFKEEARIVNEVRKAELEIAKGKTVKGDLEEILRKI